MAYVIPMCTLPVRMSKIPFSQDSQIHEVQVRKSYFVPFEPIEWLEILHMTMTDLELGTRIPNFCIHFIYLRLFIQGESIQFIRKKNVL